jgi:hypothetical protein
LGAPFICFTTWFWEATFDFEVKPSFLLKLLVAYSAAVCRYTDGHMESRNAT